MKQKKCRNCKGKGYVPVYFMMASRARGIEDCPFCKGTGKAILLPDSLAYAKSIIKDLLNNSDEYAKQRAREFLEEK